MSTGLAGLSLLGLAAFALVCGLVSLLVGLALPALDTLARAVSPSQRVRLWLGAVWSPLVLAALVVLVALLSGWFGHDHCLVHDRHHPHLCPRHAQLPGWALVGLVATASARLLWTAGQVGRQLLGAARAARALALAAERRGDLLVHDNAGARAFVLGALRPRVHVSRDLFTMEPSLVAAVLAHERTHVRRRDLAWRALCSLLSGAHVPGVGTALRRRLAMAQEMRADECAARAVGDRTRVAEALLALARTHGPYPLGAAPVAHGDVEPRVRALLSPPVTARRGLLPAVTAGGFAMTAALGFQHHHVHHTLETLLGSLAYF